MIHMYIFHTSAPKKSICTLINGFHLIIIYDFGIIIAVIGTIIAP